MAIIKKRVKDSPNRISTPISVKNSMLDVTTFMTYVFAGFGWLLFSYMYISIGEHKIHKNFMHRKILPARIYEAYPYLLDTFEAHGVRHHTVWYKEFDYEPDEIGREENLEIPMKETTLMIVIASPLWAPIFLFSVYGGFIFLGMALLHNRLWSIFHRQMHIPKNTFFKDWSFFRFLARNHFMHHKQMNRNFNVVFPFADFILGTRAKPTRSDLREMLRLGYLRPKSDAARQVIEKKRQVVQAQRSLAT